MIDIRKLPNIVHVGDIVPNNRKNSKNKWKVIYVCDKHKQQLENGRIYFICADNEIYKIGSSACKGGIKGTFASYQGGLGGSPSLRTFGIHLLIWEQLNSGKQVKIYCRWIEPIKVTMHGLVSSVEKITYPQSKDIEELCAQDYKRTYGKYPRRDFQENREEFPSYIKSLYKHQVSNRQ